MAGALAVASFIFVWWALARFWNSRGKGAFVRHLGGFSVATFVFLGIVAMIGGDETTETTSEGKSEAASISVAEKTAEKKEEVKISSTQTISEKTPVNRPVEESVATLDLATLAHDRPLTFGGEKRKEAIRE